MRTYTCISMLGLGLLSMSFTPPGVPEEPAISTGTYGVCGCDPSSSASTNISLAIHTDNTFHYVNGSDPRAAVDVEGRWELKGRTLTLWTSSSESPFEKWTMDNSCLRSRKGMTFTRLCHMEACK